MEAVVNAGHDIGGVISNVALCAIVLVSAANASSVSTPVTVARVDPYLSGGTSRMQYPNVPKLTEECRIWVWFVSVTRRRPKSLITGAEMVTMRRRMLAAKRKKTPILGRLSSYCRDYTCICG